MSKRSMLAAVSLAACAAACGGGSSSASSTFTGTVRGQAFKANDSVSATNVLIATSGSLADCTTNTDCTTQGETCISGSCGATSGRVAAVVLTSAAGLCGKVGSNVEPKSSQYFVIALGELDYNTQQVSAPTSANVGKDYAVINASTQIPPPLFAKVLFQSTNATCNSVAAQSVAGYNGSVRLSRIDNGAYSGQFDLNLQDVDGSGKATGTSDHVTGTFSTTACPGLAALVATNRKTTCQ